MYIFACVFIYVYTSFNGEETCWHYSVFVIHCFMSDKEDQTANIDTDVLGQFGHKKSEKHKFL